MSPSHSVLRVVQSRATLVRATTDWRERPDRLPRALLAMRRWGQGLVGAAAAASARYPTEPAVIDDKGSVSFRDLWTRSSAIAAALAREGAGPGSVVGLMARDHRGFVEVLLGALKEGADVILLNTRFAGPQLADVVASEGVELLVHDEEFGSIAQETSAKVCIGEDEVEGWARGADQVAPPARQGRVVVLTSGTTGRPKGATRPADARATEGASMILGRIPLRLRDTQVVAAPMFHSWGLMGLGLGLARSATTIVSREFDPERTLQAVDEQRADVLLVVPQMLQRILAQEPDVLVRWDTSTLRVIASSGAALDPTLTRAVLNRFGPVLYNLYGSTEVAAAAVATPRDLLRKPAAAGRPAPGVRLRILDGKGDPVTAGEVGRIFVGSSMGFEGYTSGGDKERAAGLIGSGDLGRIDGDGVLFVEGREDDMIVSGGENVFPAEVENMLASHPAVAEVAVVGVPDEKFGQALVAYVVRRPGRDLDADEVMGHVRTQLASYKVPRRVEFLDALPRTATGKLVRRELGS